MLDRTILRDECQPLDQPHAIHLEGRQPQRRGKTEVDVTQDFKRMMQPPGHLALILRCLGA